MIKAAKGDKINRPTHYVQGKFETIEVIEDIAQFYSGRYAVLVGNVIKYLARAPHAKGLEDLQKAQWYLNRLVAKISKNESIAVEDDD